MYLVSSLGLVEKTKKSQEIDLQRAQRKDPRKPNLFSPGHLQPANAGIEKRQNGNVSYNLSNGEPEQSPLLSSAA